MIVSAPESPVNEKEAAKILGLSPDTLAMWRHTKRVKVPYIILGGVIRYSPAALEQFKLARTVGADGISPPDIPRRRGGPGRKKKIVGAQKARGVQKRQAAR